MITILIALIIVGAAAIVAYPLFRKSSELNVAFAGSSDPVLEGLISQRDAMYSAIKDLENDHAMGKLSDADFQDMSGRLRTRAARLIRQLEAGGGYREQIERDLARRLAESAAPSPRGVCAACGTRNDSDASFCKTCGVRL